MKTLSSTTCSYARQLSTLLTALFRPDHHIHHSRLVLVDSTNNTSDEQCQTICGVLFEDNLSVRVTNTLTTFTGLAFANAATINGTTPTKASHLKIISAMNKNIVFLQQRFTPVLSSESAHLALSRLAVCQY
ncbi:hypothetical protein CEXT_680071 [Caerostris extrusa]|uniref:Uncharacterized protein n=1 Tax=Caerostris extrusa TaxID=172846 RepID=A0AAV4VAU1_CAEEX|nr:hypothetical protein CEXT_680071 [Caerostris extrusa]